MPDGLNKGGLKLCWEWGVVSGLQPGKLVSTLRLRVRCGRVLSKCLIFLLESLAAERRVDVTWPETA